MQIRQTLSGSANVFVATSNYLDFYWSWMVKIKNEHVLSNCTAEHPTLNAEKTHKCIIQSNVYTHQHAQLADMSLFNRD